MTSRERNVSVLALGALALGVNVDKAMIARTAEIVAVTRLIDVPRVRVSPIRVAARLIRVVGEERVPDVSRVAPWLMPFVAPGLASDGRQ